MSGSASKGDTLTEESHTPSTTAPASKRRRLGLSRWNISLLTTTTIGIVAAIVFLTCLWISSHEAHRTGNLADNSPWARFLRSDWIERSITITAVVIRVCATWQSAFCIPILVNFLLLKSKVRLSTFPAFSIMRASNPNPLGFLSLMHNTRWWEIKSNIIAWVLGFVICITAVLTQFTSTILLSDIGTTRVYVSFRPVEVYQLKPEDSQTQTQYVLAKRDLTLSLDSIPRFAHHSGDWQNASPQESIEDNFQDTGLTVRAFLPLSDRSMRENIHEYNGLAPVYHQRTICVAPDIRGSLSGDTYGPEINLMNGEYRIRQNANLPDYFDEVRAHFGEFASIKSINCSFAYKADGIAVNTGQSDDVPYLENDSALSFCPLYEINTAMGMNNTNRVPEYHAYLLLNWTDFAQREWLLMTAPDRLWNVNREVILDLNKTEPRPTLDDETVFQSLNLNESGRREPIDTTKENELWQSSRRGAWSVLNYKTFPDIEVSFSLCVNRFVRNEHDVRIVTSQSLPSEPSIKWDRKERKWDISAILDMFDYNPGGNRGSDAGRLQIESDASPESNITNENPINEDSEDLAGITYWHTVVKLCLACEIFLPDPAKRVITYHRNFIFAFQSTLKQTGNLAKALDVLWSMRAQSLYYETLFAGTQTIVNGNYSAYESRNLPIKWLGFPIVMGVLLLHYITMGIVFIIWFRLGRHLDYPEVAESDVNTDDKAKSLGGLVVMGDSWRAIHQATHGEVEGAYEGLGDMDDSETRKTLRRRKMDVHVGVAWADGGSSGKVVVR